MSYPINYPTPQGANVQIFKEGGSTSDWVKPQGASFVWFTLIGAGSRGTLATNGGGSGAVTNFMGPAFLIPDVLNIKVGRSGITSTNVIYQQKDGTGYTLLTANTGSTGGAGGSAMAANYFTAMGFFQSIAGQAGTGGNVSASTTTFLSGGGGAAGATITANYGYTNDGGAPGNASGLFQMQPIIVGLGSAGTGKAGIGCGGGDNAVSTGGDGMVVIITW